MNFKDITTGIITGSILSLAGMFFLFQERVSKLEEKYTQNYESSATKEKKIKQVPSGADSAKSNYVAHQFHFTEMKRAQCLDLAINAAKNHGFNNLAKQELDDYDYGVAYGMNSDGYTFQYTCVPKKSIAYLIVNGPEDKQRVALRNDLGNMIKVNTKK